MNLTNEEWNLIKDILEKSDTKEDWDWIKNILENFGSKDANDLLDKINDDEIDFNFIKELYLDELDWDFYEITNNSSTLDLEHCGF
jgi:hypothetical protein